MSHSVTHLLTTWKQEMLAHLKTTLYKSLNFALLFACLTHIFLTVFFFQVSLSEVHTSNTGGGRRGFKKHPIWILLQTIYSPESAKVHRLLETSSSTPPPPPLLSVSLRLSPTHKLTLARTALALFLILWSLWKKAFLLKYYVESFHLSSSYSNRTIHNKKTLPHRRRGVFCEIATKAPEIWE